MNPFFGNQEKLVRVLYRNVTNTEEIRKLIFAEQLPLCLLKPKYIVDAFQLSVAVSKALHNNKESCMNTKTFASELIYCLSPSKNISESIKTFGTEASETDFVIVGEEQVFLSIKDAVQGEQANINQISELTDHEAVKKLYDIQSEELLKSSLLDSVITRMSTKDYNI